MRKLTKIVKRRHKNYKPTIGGIDIITNKQVSVNAVVFYVEKEKERKYQAEQRAKQEMRKVFMSLVKEKMPNLFSMLNIFGDYWYY